MLKVKNECKIVRKDSCEMRNINPPCNYCKLCQSLEPKFCFQCLDQLHGWFEATKKSNLWMSWNYQNYLTRAPIIKIHMMWDFFEHANYILIVTSSFVQWCCYVLIENKNKFYYINVRYIYVTEFALAETT